MVTRKIKEKLKRQAYKNMRSMTKEIISIITKELNNEQVY